MTLESIVLFFDYNGKAQIIPLKIEDSDFWLGTDDFDIHYCEDYNEICVYLKQTEEQTSHPFKLIYKQSIN